MTQASKEPETLQSQAQAMKRDWDERARANAKWFINTVKQEQPDAEFNATGKPEIDRHLLADPLVIEGHDPRRLRVLEIGCGIGRMTWYLAEHFGEVYATDVSGEMIQQARQRLSALPNVHLYETNGLDFACLPSDYFDIVFSIYVFQHVPSAEVIYSNIRDAHRVLKPGGVLKIETCGITVPAYDAIRKDTWTGASFSEAEIRCAAREVNACLISILGAGTQYCWTVMRKRQPEISRAQTFAIAEPRIAFFGRSDDPQTRRIHTRGDYAYLTLILSGLVREQADINSVNVWINNREVWPCYVGPLGENYAAALRAAGVRGLDHLTQVNLGIPDGCASGEINVRAQLASGERTAPITVELVEPPPVAPKIHLIRNAGDAGIDIYARGPKSAIVVYVDGLNEAANTGNVRLQVNEQIIQPSYVGFVPANGLYQVDAKLPASLAPGVASLRIHFGELESASIQLEVKGD
jgi:SAM-dependent methyltransferase